MLLEKVKKTDTDITITTSQGESRGKFIDATEFKKIVENDGVEYNERSLAYTAKDGNRYINEAAIRRVRSDQWSRIKIKIAIGID